jgi:plastocyanin
VARSFGRIGFLVAVAATALVTVTLPVSAGGGGHCAEPLAEGAGTAVDMVDACFAPAVLHVGIDEEVTFTNLDPMAHNVAPAGWGWGHIDDIAEGGSFSATFDEAGVYPYACSLHPGMTGAVIVGGTADAGSADAGELAVVADVAEPPTHEGTPWWAAIAGALGLVAGYLGARARRGDREPQPYQPTSGA